jgi:hypothetical protein
MTCGFTLEHYREILRAAREGGYRFAAFAEAPVDGDLLLRHDVDLSLEAALAMAELEAEEDATTTYLLMTRSVFYNLASREGEAALRRLRALGHAVGLHAVHPHVDLDDRFDAVVAWHNPEREYMTARIDGAANPMEPRFFDPATYRSDSNHRWRSGCPHEELRAGAFPWLQVLVHPEIWVYPGSTMGATMDAMLDAQRAHRLELLADDRIDLT